MARDIFRRVCVTDQVFTDLPLGVRYTAAPLHVRSRRKVSTKPLTCSVLQEIRENCEVCRCSCRGIEPSGNTRYRRSVELEKRPLLADHDAVEDVNDVDSKNKANCWAFYLPALAQSMKLFGRNKVTSSKTLH